MKKKEIIIIVGVLVLALGGYIGVKLYNNTLDKTKVVVEHDGTDVLEFDPNIDAVYTVEGSYGSLQIEVVDHRWHVINEDCPNHICAKTGWSSVDNFVPITCVPNKIYIGLKN